MAKQDPKGQCNGQSTTAAASHPERGDDSIAAMLLRVALSLCACAFLLRAPSAQTAPYCPPAGAWDRREPAAAGFDAAKLAEAIKFAEQQPTNWPKDFSTQEQQFGKLLGPMPKDRAGTNGVIVRGGYLVATFGEVERCDPTYSVAKSMLSTVVGVAVRVGLIADLDEPVQKSVKDGGYDSEQNAKVTWRHHLQQESEWQGELWGKKDDFVGRVEFGSGARRAREQGPPGSRYEYNDVRVNRFALSLLRLFGKSVPDVFAREVMQPISASTEWRWIPYDNAFVELEGKRVPSVSGGTRWGGGVWISAMDLARFGLLWARGGKWAERQIVPESYVQAALQPSTHGPDYGFLWWLNTKQKNWPGLPANCYGARGAGSNSVFVSPDHDLVIVWRWHATEENADAKFFSMVTAALRPPESMAPVRQFTVALYDGKLEIAELTRALLKSFDLDDGALPLPSARIDLAGMPGWLAMYAARKVLMDTVRFRRDLSRGELVVTIDRERVREVRLSLRARVAQFAGQLAGEDVTLRGCALALPEGLDRKRPLCVLVHGMDSSAEVWSDLQQYLKSLPGGIQVATFRYPDDASIERTAAELSARLRTLGGQPLAIVAHSMGGVIARAVVEDPELDPGNVKQLILIATPNQGSNLAGFRFALEVADVLREADGERAFGRELLAAAIDHWRDGLGSDLLPGSVCLARLAQCKRNPRVEYHVVLGTRSVLQPAQLAALQQVKQALAKEGAIAVLRPRLERWLDDLDELVDGKGDGAVSVARGRLSGVEPMLVPLDHQGLVRCRGALGGTVAPADHPVFKAIAGWLGAK